MRNALSRLLLVALVSLVSSSALRAEEEAQVLLTQLGGDQLDETLAAQVDVGLRNEMKKVVGERLISAAPAPPSGCEAGACVRKLARAHSAALVVIATVEAGDHANLLVARLLDAEGRVIVMAERSFSTTPDFRVLRGLATQLLVPGQYTGRLRVVDAADDAHLLVDGIALSAAEKSAPFALSVGTHEVSVEAAGAVARTLPVEVGFDTETTLSVAPVSKTAPVTDVSPVEPPLWPAIAAASLTGVAAAATAAAAADLVYTTLTLDLLYTKFEQGSGFQIEDRVADLREDNTTYAPTRRGQRNGAVLLASAGAITVITAVATGALLTDWALRGGEEESE